MAPTGGVEFQPLYKGALVIQEIALSSNHPDVANSLNRLANLYYLQGQYAQAEPLFKRSLAIYEVAFRPDHPKVISSLKDIADFYLKTDHIKKAEVAEYMLAVSHHSGFSPENEITK